MFCYLGSHDLPRVLLGRLINCSQRLVCYPDVLQAAAAAAAAFMQVMLGCQAAPPSSVG